MSKLTVIYKVLHHRYRCLIIVVNAYSEHWFRPQWYPFKNYQSHFVFSPASSKVKNSEFIVERAMHVRLEDF